MSHHSPSQLVLPLVLVAVVREKTIKAGGMGRDKEDKTEMDSVVPWMRAPVDVSNVENCALDTLPCLNPK